MLPKLVMPCCGLHLLTRQHHHNRILVNCALAQGGPQQRLQATCQCPEQLQQRWPGCHCRRHWAHNWGATPLCNDSVDAEPAKPDVSARGQAIRIRIRIGIRPPSGQNQTRNQKHACAATKSESGMMAVSSDPCSLSRLKLSPCRSTAQICQARDLLQ